MQIINETKSFTVSRHPIAGMRHELDKSMYAKNGNALSSVRIYLAAEYGMIEGQDYTIDSGMTYTLLRIERINEINAKNNFFQVGEYYDLDIDFASNTVRMYQDKG
ncbi:hypothetical protein [Vibrio phage XZ1]|nr:hypothetical protein [Vibrio phage XZ1]